MLQERIDTLLTRKLSGEATDTEIRELELYIQQSPGLQSIINTTIEHWNTKHVTDEEFLEATYLQHLARMKNKGIDFLSPEFSHHDQTNNSSFKRSMKRIIVWTVPLGLILFLGIRMMSSKELTKSEQLVASTGSNEISTRNGSRSSKIQLPDGSTVWLNAGSKLEYDKSFGNILREVTLIGEAYFDVVKNPAKPFIVNTNTAKVKVLGTAFNVRSYPEDNKIETSLIRGSVEVTLNKRPDERWILKPNEKLVLLNDYVAPQQRERVPIKKIPNEPVIAIKKLTYQPGESVAVETAWTYNKLSFEEESFAEVANKMARWYDVNFIFKNKELEEMMLHGSFTTETINQAMEALQYSFKFKYEIKDKQVTIY